ncbi:MAG TPA: hypothetical protein DCM86_09555, partial [Verrucomicrobiales bacterium]|nr:hypothetical protein [Verrucomicrobiales bacterium]
MTPVPSGVPRARRLGWLGLLAVGVVASRLAGDSSPSSPGPSGSRVADEGRRGGIRMPTPAFRTEVPSHPVDLILGRPSPHGVTVSVLSYADSEG